MTDACRQTGYTTEQIRLAPLGAMFVWVNDKLSYPKDLARSLGRPDIKIVSPSYLDRVGALRGFRGAVIVDHAARLNALRYDRVREHEYVRRGLS